MKQSNQTFTNTTLPKTIILALPIKEDYAVLTEQERDKFLTYGPYADFDDEIVLKLNLTPKLAWRLLQTNISNRNISLVTIEKLVGAIQRDEWIYTGAALTVTPEGNLIDGQHRCCAIYWSGIPCEVKINFGIPKKAQGVMDIGLKREIAHQYALNGEKNSKQLSSAIRWQWRNENDRLLIEGALSHPTPKQSFDTLDRHPDMRQSVEIARPAFKLIHESLAIWLHYQLSRNDPYGAQDFFHRLGRGTNLEERNPILVLREALIKMHNSGLKYDVARIISYTIRAWNYYKTDKKLKNFGAWNGEQFPIIK